MDYNISNRKMKKLKGETREKGEIELFSIEQKHSALWRTVRNQNTVET